MLLERYVRCRFPLAAPEERRAFARLLERPDPQLAGYLLGGLVPDDPQLAALAGHIARLPASGAGGSP